MLQRQTWSSLDVLCGNRFQNRVTNSGKCSYTMKKNFTPDESTCVFFRNGCSGDCNGCDKIHENAAMMEKYFQAISTVAGEVAKVHPGVTFDDVAGFDLVDGNPVSDEFLADFCEDADTLKLIVECRSLAKFQSEKIVKITRSVQNNLRVSGVAHPRMSSVPALPYTPSPLPLLAATNHSAVCMPLRFTPQGEMEVLLVEEPYQGTPCLKQISVSGSSCEEPPAFSAMRGFVEETLNLLPAWAVAEMASRIDPNLFDGSFRLPIIPERDRRSEQVRCAYPGSETYLNLYLGEGALVETQLREPDQNLMHNKERGWRMRLPTVSKFPCQATPFDAADTSYAPVGQYFSASSRAPYCEQNVDKQACMIYAPLLDYILPNLRNLKDHIRKVSETVKELQTELFDIKESQQHILRETADYLWENIYELISGTLYRERISEVKRNVYELQFFSTALTPTVDWLLEALQRTAGHFTIAHDLLESEQFDVDDGSFDFVYFLNFVRESHLAILLELYGERPPIFNTKMTANRFVWVRISELQSLVGSTFAPACSCPCEPEFGQLAYRIGKCGLWQSFTNSVCGLPVDLALVGIKSAINPDQLSDGYATMASCLTMQQLLDDSFHCMLRLFPRPSREGYEIFDLSPEQREELALRQAAVPKIDEALTKFLINYGRNPMMPMRSLHEQLCGPLGIPDDRPRDPETGALVEREFGLSDDANRLCSHTRIRVIKRPVHNLVLLPSLPLENFKLLSEEEERLYQEQKQQDREARVERSLVGSGWQSTGGSRSGRGSNPRSNYSSSSRNRQNSGSRPRQVSRERR